MLRYLIFFFILFQGSVFLQAQVENTPIKVGRVTVFQTGGGAGYWEVTGTFNDESGFHDGTIAIGDVLFFSDAGYGFYLPVTTIVSNTMPSFVVRVNNTGITLLSGVPTTSGSIYTPTTNLDLPFFTSGMTNADQQTLLNYLVQKIDMISAGGLPTILDGQTYVSMGANNPVGTTLGGDITMNNTGGVTIIANAITGPELAPNSVANIAMADNSITTNEIVDGTIALGDLNFVPLTGLTAGTNISITGSAPNLTINSTGTSTIFGPYPSQEAAAIGGVTTGQLFYVGFGSTTHSKDTILRKN